MPWTTFPHSSQIQRGAARISLGPTLITPMERKRGRPLCNAETSFRQSTANRKQRGPPLTRGVTAREVLNARGRPPEAWPRHRQTSTRVINPSPRDFLHGCALFSELFNCAFPEREHSLTAAEARRGDVFVPKSPMASSTRRLSRCVTYRATVPGMEQVIRKACQDEGHAFFQ